ncbi:hypothetical protein [Dactylosporangium fulvum]|uniref:Uncharacterized protein n=1 Tax=Dactylosporangium fulvum TaxID=53359 RepID=A0ABY5W8F5_9ACTN|nr:hypothetical protein [Dactylosporangium fulvum]UWP85289.1 hypothetical protein Dfulv_14070 [Dactylosporangium fulvum]
MERTTAYSGWHPQPFPGPEWASRVLWSATRLLSAWTGEVRAEVTPAGDPAAGVPTDAATARALLAERIPVADRRAESMRDWIADHLAGPYGELTRTERDGALHLVRTDRHRPQQLTVSSGKPSGAIDATTRVACAMTLLSKLLWLNNNTPVRFCAWTGPREHADPDAEAVAALARTREDEDGDEEPPVPRAVTLDQAYAGMENIVRGSLLELMDGSWSGVDECPPVPDGHVSRHLYRDLLAALTPDRLEYVAVAGYVPLRWTEEDLEMDEEVGTILLVGAGGTAVLDVDLMI